MPGANQLEPKKPTGIEKLSETTRKKILVSSVAVISLLLVIFWAANFRNSINLEQDPQSAQEFNQLLETTKQGLEQISQEVGKIKQASQLLEDLATTTQEVELSQEEIDKLKEKILEQQAAQTASSSATTTQ